MKQNLKTNNQKGITLVALVVTIVVLLILAGITIAALFSENGIINAAENASSQTKKSQIISEIQLKLLGKNLSSAPNKAVKVTEEDIQDAIGEDGVINRDAEENIVSITKKGITIPIEEIYNGAIEIPIYTITYNSNGGSGSMENATGTRITIANNTFTAPEGKQFKEWNTNAEGTGTKYNVGSTARSSLTLYAIWEGKKDANGVEAGQSGYLGSNYKDPYIPVGFTHTEGTWNSGYTIKGNEGTTNADDEFVWVPCTLTATSETVAFARLTTNGTKYNSNNLTDFSDQDGARADSIKTSVGIHKGFYIAKYEASSSNDSDMQNGTVRSLPNKTPWVSIQRSAAIDKANAMVNTEDNVKSALISGECWDTTLQWMVSKSDNATENTTTNAYDINSTDKGWYSNNSERSKKNTGTGINSTNPNKVNNIWDMAGNVWEWTSENCKTDGGGKLVIRGGRCTVSGSNIPAAYRTYGVDQANDGIGFRVVLYK